MDKTALKGTAKMDEPRTNSEATRPADAGTQTSALASQLAKATDPNLETQKSWGDKYKEKTLGFVRNVGVNYVVNFLISAVFAYEVEKSAVGAKLNDFAKGVGTQGAKVGIPKEVGQFVGSFITKVQLLMCGGHALLPFMKYTHDNRRALEFGIGHRLDQLQESMGQGNDASKRRLQEFKVVRGLLKTKPHELSEDEKALLAKNCIDEHLRFTERKSSWNHVLKARLGGVAATTSLSVGLALGQSTGKSWLNFKGLAKDKVGNYLDTKVIPKIPVIGPKITVPLDNTLGENMFTEVVYTLFSKLGFDRIEKRQLKKELAAEQKAASTQLNKDEKSLEHITVLDEGTGPDFRASVKPQTIDTRNRILSEGKKDFRMREASRPQETVALS